VLLVGRRDKNSYALFVFFLLFYRICDFKISLPFKGKNMTLQEDSVLVNVDATVATLTINRPQAMNALNVDVLNSIMLRLEKTLLQSEIRAVIITGSGDKAFVAGADVAQMHDLGPRAIADYVTLGQRTMRMLETVRVPVIAAVNGYALGGGLELALSCDIIIASKLAKFGQPEVNLGIIPGFGGTQRLLARTGIGAAKRLILTGEIISAEEAKMINIVEILVEPAELMATAKKYADMIASKAPLAVQSAKKILTETAGAWQLGGLQREVEEFLKLFATADREEGMEAFLKRRSAVFHSR